MHKAALARIMDIRLDQETSSIVMGPKPLLRKPIIVILWLFLGAALFLSIGALFIKFKGSDILTFDLVMLLIEILSAIFIRRLTYKKTINLAEARFEFTGQLRKNWIFTLADYEGAETRRTVKDFPEEFWVNFRTDKGTKSFKLADLNMGRACDIEPNHEAVRALWDAIIRQIQIHNKNNSKTDNPQEVAPDTD